MLQGTKGSKYNTNTALTRFKNFSQSDCSHQSKKYEISNCDSLQSSIKFSGSSNSNLQKLHHIESSRYRQRIPSLPMVLITRLSWTPSRIQPRLLKLIHVCLYLPMLKMILQLHPPLSVSLTARSPKSNMPIFCTIPIMTVHNVLPITMQNTIK